MKITIEETIVDNGEATATIAGTLTKREAYRFTRQPGTESYDGKGTYYHTTAFHVVHVDIEAQSFEISATDSVEWCGGEKEAAKSAECMLSADTTYFEDLIWTASQLAARKQKQEKKWLDAKYDRLMWGQNS